jgi:transcriptional regulator with XRE-family HTH domain
MILSTDESTARSRFLGHELRTRRRAAGLTLSDVATRMKLYASTLTRVEKGERGLTLTNLVTYLALCGVVGTEQQALLELARAREDQWWTCPHDGAGPDELPALWFTLKAADRVTCWHPGAVPELLQTDELAAWQLQSRHGATADVAARHAERTERQQEYVLGPSLRKLTFHLPESALRSLPVEDNVRSGQMAHLAMLIAEERVRIRVLPERLDHGVPAIGRFWLFGFRGHASTVCAQTEGVSVFAERAQDVQTYELSMKRLDALALSEQDSADLIAGLGEDHPAFRQHRPFLRG